MLSDIIHEITHELTVPKLIVGLLAYIIIHSTYKVLNLIEKKVQREAVKLIKAHIHAGGLLKSQTQPKVEVGQRLVLEL